MNLDCLVIIRSAHERTELLCRKLILDQGVPEGQVITVHEVPFSASMRRSFEMGISSGFAWTFCIDADVLLRPLSIHKMLELANEQEENVCEIQGFVMDKFFGGPRPAGNHLYRTSLLGKVIRKIPEEGVNIRPEYYALESMVAEGHPWVNVPYVVGIHDDEQYYRDIFRKAFVQASKHDFLIGLFLEIWKKGARNDRDFEIALKGLAAGIEYVGEVFIDIGRSIYSEKFSSTGVIEKENLDACSITLDEIENRILGMPADKSYLARFPDLSSFGRAPAGKKGAARGRSDKPGFLTAILRSMGAGMRNLGQFMDSASRKF